MTTTLIRQAMEVAQSAARDAGQVLRSLLATAEVYEKGPKDLVTNADMASQRLIEQRVAAAFPDHRFLGEESTSSTSSPSTSKSLPSEETEWQWVVDPLDGTVNYVHRLPNFAVSIALMHGSEIEVGVVYDPMADELFSSIRGEPAMLNNQPIRVSNCHQLKSALVAASFPPQITRESRAVEQFIEILVRSQSVRRLGSAALNLCYVACGRLDAYWAGNLSVWDIAGGALIAQNAGAVFTDLSGEPFDPWRGELVVASSSLLQAELRECLASKRFLSGGEHGHLS